MSLRESQIIDKDEQLGPQSDGSYLTPYSHVAFYNPNSFVETALASLTEKTQIIPYCDLYTQIDWDGLADMPKYICPSVVLFDSFEEKIPLESLKFIQRGFGKVFVLTNRPNEYPGDLVCVKTFGEYFDVFQYISFAHEEVIDMLLEYQTGLAKESTHNFFRGILFGTGTTSGAVGQLAKLIASGVRSIENIQRAQYRGVTITDIGNHIGRSACAGAHRAAGWVVVIIPPLLTIDHSAPDCSGSFKKYIKDHIVSLAKPDDKYGAFIYPVQDKWSIETFSISQDNPPETPRLVTRDELRQIIPLEWI